MRTMKRNEIIACIDICYSHRITNNIKLSCIEHIISSANNMDYNFTITDPVSTDAYNFNGHSMLSYAFKNANIDLIKGFKNKVNVNTSFIENKKTGERLASILPLLYLEELNLSTKSIEKIVIDYIKNGAYFKGDFDFNFLFAEEVKYNSNKRLIFKELKERVNLADIALLCKQMDLFCFLSEHGVECRSKIVFGKYKESIMILDNYYNDIKKRMREMNAEEKSALKIYNILKNTNITINFSEISLVNSVIKFDLHDKINKMGMAKKILNSREDNALIKSMLTGLSLNKEELSILFADKRKEADNNKKYSEEIWNTLSEVFVDAFRENDMHEELNILSRPNIKTFKRK